MLVLGGGMEYLLYVIRAMSAISVPVGPHGSLLVAVAWNISILFWSDQKCFEMFKDEQVGIPFLTLTCTEL